MPLSIGGSKSGNMVDSGAATLATGCPACMMRSIDLLSRRQAPARVRHAIELYADSL